MKTQIIQPLVKLRRVVYGMIALGCAYLLSFFIYPTLLPESTQATAGVAVEPYLEISPSNSVAFSVNPGTFNSASQTLSVRTTNYTGYKLTLSANASADLVGSRGTIPTITLPGNASSITSSGFTNGYGYSLNATDYKPVLTGVGSTLDTTSVPNPTANTYTLTFGAKVNQSVPAGAYTKTFTVTATANDTGYVITYNANAGGDTVTGMPSPNPQQSTISGLSVNLSSNTPERSGYNFLGWDEDDEAETPTYEAGDSFTLDPETANTLTLYAVWESAGPRCDAGKICYQPNNESAVGTMTDQTASSNSSVTLMGSNYSLANYGFAGWNTEADGSGTSYGPMDTATTGDLSSKGMNLFAVWVPKSTTYTMQTFTATACNAMSDGDIIALEDARDGQVYSVVKIQKSSYGQCWMMENLRLDVKNANITASNTNHPTSSFLTQRTSGTWQTCSANSATCDDQVSFSLANMDRNKTANYNASNQNSSWYSYGGMYNWYTATAGRGTYSQSSGRAGGDICPSGWHMPTGGSSNNTNDYYNLNVALNNNSNVTNSDAKLRGYPANFVYSGLYYGSSAYDRGSNGYYWSSTANIDNNGYLLSFGSGYVYPGTNYYDKYYGQAVRCLANVSEESFTLTYNANGGSGAPASQNGSSASRGYTFTLSSSTPTYSGLTFSGWATSATATEAEVQAGEQFEATAAATTLYAVWKPMVTIVFNASGGTGTMANMGVPSGKSKNLTANAFTKSGYTFAGWTTTEGSTTIDYTNSASYTAPTVSQDTTVNLYAVWGRSRKISYNGNNATNGTMTNTHSTNEYASVALYAPNFYRTDYGFAGWSETQVDPTASNALTTISNLASQGKIYGPNESITVPVYTSASAMTLYAVWVPKDTTYNLQTFASANRCSTMSEGDFIALQDSRDSNVYTVTKLADGNCWMTENLRLNPNDSNTSITASNTHNPTSTFINTDLASITTPYFKTCTSNNTTCDDQLSFGLGNITGTSNSYNGSNQTTSRWYAYGVMYNWYTATAGNGSYNDGSGVVANGDICPSGWHLPYGGSGTGTKGGNTDGGFYYLGSRLGATSSNATSSNIWRSYPNNFVYSGRYYGSSASNRGSVGYYWSSTAYGNSLGGYYLYFYSSYVYPGTGIYNKYYGQAVRCLAD